MTDSSETGPGTLRAIDRPHVSFRSLMLGTGPRFARDAVGPVLAFDVAWKLVGLGAGIVPITLALMAWSLWYGVRSFQRSTEWGAALADQPRRSA